jgi:putative intracellular protease/amidase
MFPVSPIMTKEDQDRSNEQARIIQRANAAFDAVFAAGGTREDADAAYIEIMKEMGEI